MFKLDLNYRRIGYVLAIGTVAAVAARVSYSHIRDVTLEAGQPIDVATVLPLAVDGMLLAATLAMAEDKANGRLPRAWARFGFWFGAVISVACNVASTIVHITTEWLPLAVFIAALAPVLLLITVEIMARPGKIRPAEDAPEAMPAVKARTPEDRLRDARKRAKYDQMTATEKAAWTKRYNERVGRNAPVSPAGPLVASEAELEEITA